VEVIDRAYAAILAAKTPAERVAMMDSMHRAARLMLESRVRELFPHAAPAERKREYLRRLLGHGTIADLEARG
jgi:anti-sigma factor RsiW